MQTSNTASGNNGDGVTAIVSVSTNAKTPQAELDEFGAPKNWPSRGVVVFDNVSLPVLLVS